MHNLIQELNLRWLIKRTIYFDQLTDNVFSFFENLVLELKENAIFI